MAVLTTEERKRVPESKFGLPAKRKYPMPDKAHARNALARVAQFGNSEEKAKVRRKAHELYPGIGR